MRINDIKATDSNSNELRAFFGSNNLDCLITVKNDKGDLVTKFHIEFLDDESRMYFSDELETIELFTEVFIFEKIFEFPYHVVIINGDVVDTDGHLYPYPGPLQA
ncbi:MAG: hypothetical protein GY743_23570 [Planctomycetaceae bacterium]|nr:hypothetical protein [Planctomycetaceae bacterium]